MTTKDLKKEAREKLALNIHQAIAVYAIVFLIYVTLIALIVMSCVGLATQMKLGAVVMICYGVVLFLAMTVVSGIIGFAMADFYLACYRAIPYNIRRLGDTIARSGVHKILLMNIVRTLLGFLLLLLLIVPGVIYLVRTSMASHLLIANPRMKAKEALKASSKVMSGKCGAYLALMVSMLGWLLLGVLTLGLGFIFILPYVNLVKTVYYKRNLQGDRNTYSVQPQPVGQIPVIENPSVVTPQQQFEAQPVAPDDQPIVEAVVAQVQDDEVQVSQASARPIVIDPDMQPVASLNENDIKEMNETMRDFGSEAVIEVDVPEVPLKPVTAASAASASAKKEDVVVEPPQETAVSKPVDDSNLVEIVKPLTTLEVSETNPYAQKIDDMLTGSKSQSGVKHDYFGEKLRNQSPDDFVTTEVGADQIPFASGTKVEQPVSSADQGDPVMSDEAFAEFIRNFDDLSKAQSEPVAPKQRDPDPIAAATSGAAKVSTPASGAANRAVGADSGAARPSPVGNSAPSADDRAEKLRREREERLNNLRKNRERK